MALDHSRDFEWSPFVYCTRFNLLFLICVINLPLLFTNHNSSNNNKIRAKKSLLIINSTKTKSYRMINFSKQTGELCKNPNHKITEMSSRRLNPTNDGDFGVKRDAKWQMQNFRFTQYFQFHVINFLSLISNNTKMWWSFSRRNSYLIRIIISCFWSYAVQRFLSVLAPFQTFQKPHEKDIHRQIVNIFFD